MTFLLTCRPINYIFAYSKQIKKLIGNSLSTEAFDSVGAEQSERSRADLGRANRRAVFASIIFNDSISRTEISTETGLTNAAVSRITRDLIDAGLVIESGAKPDSTKPGRRFVGLQANPTGGYVFGVGINAFQQFVTVSDQRNRPIMREELRLSRLDEPTLVLDAVAEKIQEMKTNLRIPEERIFGGSVAITGAVDPTSGVLLNSPAFGWADVRVGPYLADLLDMPIHVENVPNALNLAESWFGIGRKYSDVLLLNASLGIGSSLLTNNNLTRGKNFATGLVGGVRLRELGPDSDFGERGLLDEIAGGWSILNQVYPNQKIVLQEAARCLQRLLEAAEEGDTSINQIFFRAGRALGAGIDMIGGLICPQAVILSGPLARSKSYVAGVTVAINEYRDFENRVNFLVSDMTFQTAARWLAINEFLVNRDIDITKLKMLEAA